MQTDEPGGQWGNGANVERATFDVELSTDGQPAIRPRPLGLNLRSDSQHRNGMGLQSSSVDDRFPTAGRGVWSRVPDADWNDWRWQLRNRIATLEALEALMPLTPAEREGVALAGHHLAMAITPYFF